MGLPKAMEGPAFWWDFGSDDVSDNLAFKHFSEDVKVEPIVIKTFDTKVVKHVGVLVKP